MGLSQQRRGTIAGSGGSPDTTYSLAVMADSPLLYWRLDQPSGTTITDSSGNSRSGTATATGITYSATAVPPFGSVNAMTFNGTAGGILQTSNINMDAYTSITVEFWANIPSFNNTDDMAAEFMSGGSNSAGGLSIDPCQGGGDWSMGAHTQSGVNFTKYTRPSTGAAHHYAFVFTKNIQSNALVAYLDGALWTPNNRTETGPLDAAWGTGKFSLASRNAASLFLNATMDEFAVYGTDLGATRVLAHYDAGNTGP